MGSFASCPVANATSDNCCERTLPPTVRPLVAISTEGQHQSLFTAPAQPKTDLPFQKPATHLGPMHFGKQVRILLGTAHMLNAFTIVGEHGIKIN
jgi:hypothetical protein